MKFKNKNILEYESFVSVYPNIVVPMKTLIPKWFTNKPKWLNNSLKNGEFLHTFKQCMPFLDSMTTGYAILLPYDLYVVQKDGHALFSWMHEGLPLVVAREPVAHEGLPTPEGHSKDSFVWQLPLTIKIPKNYSYLFTHPLNRYDLPFTTLSAIVDGGWALVNHANVPFYINNNFEGLIPQGTPIAQIIPFKTNKWTAKINKGLMQESFENAQRHHSLISGWYKKVWWQKKDYS